MLTPFTHARTVVRRRRCRQHDGMAALGLMTPTVRVLVVDDQLAFHEAARAVIDATAGFEWIGGASCGEEGVEQAERLRPDLVLMDVRMPGIGGSRRHGRSRREGFWRSWCSSLPGRLQAMPVLAVPRRSFPKRGSAEPCSGASGKTMASRRRARIFPSRRCHPARSGRSVCQAVSRR